MKHLLIVLFAATMMACNSQAPKTDLAVPEAPVATASKAGVEFEGANVDLLKKLVASIEKGDWDAAQSCFADSAMVWYNAWPQDTTQKGVLATDIVAREKAERVNWSGVSYGDPIYEVVITPDGQQYGHIWARYTAKHAKTGKSVDVPLFASFLITDGKLDMGWEFYDSKKFD